METKQATLEYLRDAIKYAPRDPGKLSAELTGWEHENGTKVCAHCAGRIMARGCRFQGFEPIWKPAKVVCEIC